MDAGDNVLRHVDRLLLTASNLSVEDVFSHVAALEVLLYLPMWTEILTVLFQILESFLKILNKISRNLKILRTKRNILRKTPILED